MEREYICTGVVIQGISGRVPRPALKPVSRIADTMEAPTFYTRTRIPRKIAFLHSLPRVSDKSDMLLEKEHQPTGQKPEARVQLYLSSLSNP